MYILRIVGKCAIISNGSKMKLEMCPIEVKSGKRYTKHHLKDLRNVSANAWGMGMLFIPKI